MTREYSIRTRHVQYVHIADIAPGWTTTEIKANDPGQWPAGATTENISRDK